MWSARPQSCAPDQHQVRTEPRRILYPRADAPHMTKISVWARPILVFAGSRLLFSGISRKSNVFYFTRRKVPGGRWLASKKEIPAPVEWEPDMLPPHRSAGSSWKCERPLLGLLARCFVRSLKLGSYGILKIGQSHQSIKRLDLTSNILKVIS
jgi:hypothetical protein